MSENLTIAELRKKTDAELRECFLSSKRERLNLRFQRANGELQNTSRFRQLRRLIARVKTVLNERKNQAAA
jgi:large subunit ribosomal protein L29